MLSNQTGSQYGEKEDAIPEFKPPLMLDANIKVKFWEDWDFGLELTPQGGTYYDL